MSQVDQLVSTSSILWMTISGLIALFVPIAAYVLVRLRYKTPFFPVAIGAASFLVSALLLERLVHTLLLNQANIFAFLHSQWWVWGLYGGLMAGIFEESARLVAFCFLLRRSYQYATIGGMFAYGIGHGGFEAIALCTFPMLSNIVLSLLFNSGGADALTGFGLSALSVTSLMQTPSFVFFISALERTIAFSFHIAASCLVWMAVSGRGPRRLFLLAILFHTIFNFPAALLSFGIITNVLIIEAIFLVLAAIICFITAKIYEKCSQMYTPLLRYDPL